MEIRRGGERRTEQKRGKNIKKRIVQHSLVVLLVVALVFGSLALANAETLLHNEPPGTIITFSGKQWMILDQKPDGTTYIILNSNDGNRAFDPDNTQLFNPSDSNNIGYYLNNTFYNSLSQKDLVVDHSWDRKFMDGTGSQSNVTAKISLISYSEYQAYRSLFPANGTGYIWWTRTPQKTYSIGVLAVNESGGIGAYVASASYGIRPVLYLQSGTLVDQNKVVIGSVGNLAPATPVGVSASSESSTSITISWQANTETYLAGYKIYRNNTLLATVDKNTTTYSDTMVVPGTTYTYQISAYNTSNLESDKSSPVTVTTPPATPTGVTGQATGRNITLTWQGPGNPQYIIERSTDGISFTQVAEVTQASFTETAPLWETTYYYRVAQKGQDGAVSAFSDPVQVTTDPVPVPTNLTATLDGNNVNLAWQSAEGITSYVVERSTDNATWSSLANVSNATSYTDQATDPNTTYYYRVRSDGGNGQISEPSNTAVIITPPAAPTSLTATAAGRNISITWSGSAGAASYVIQRSTDGTNFSQIAEVMVTSYSDSVPNWNTVYYYRVLAKSESGLLSSPSNTVQVKIAPAPPANLRASVSYNNVTLSWDSSDGAASYIVQRSSDRDGTWLDIGSTSQHSYTDSGLGWNLTFNYRVLAKSADGLISESSSVSATTENVPAPTGLTASLSGNDVTLNWQAAPYVNLYLIERSTDGQTWEFLVEVGFSTTYVDMGLDLNSDYYYRVKSDGGNQVSEPSNVVKVTAPPAAPTNLQATVDGKTVTLTWNGQDSMTFIIERSDDGQTWGQVAEVTEKTCQDTVPSWETIYYYRVLAKNSDGMISEPSETAQAVIPAIPEPTGLTANISGNTVNLSWTGIKGISTYRIERSQNGIFWSDLIEVNATSYQDPNLAWETKYYYRVRAVDGDQASKPSETVSAETPAPPVPEAPRITYIVDNTNVEMSWNYQRNCDGFKVYINNSLAAELPSSKTNYSFTGERGKSYTVVIEAYNAYGKASSSITVNISEMPTPGAGTMAGDILKYGGAVVVSTGGLIALGLALKGSGWLMAVIKMFLWR